MIVLDVILWLIVSFLVSSVNIIAGFDKALKLLLFSIMVIIIVKFPRWIDESGNVRK